ncbi:MAG: hypothetical protein JOZ53_21885 [Planctomycetaceae bacterium]|nr:hypothetical protein [Planctomycetaceae bacterium]
MRGHDQTGGRARRRAGFWLIVTALLVSVPGQAQDGLGPQWPGLATDAVDLAAHAIHVWSSGDEQWLVLRGRAAILQGVEGLRAGEAVVRIISAPDPSTPGRRLEVYAEDQVQMVGQTGPPLRRLRTTLRTEKDVRLKPYEDGGLVRLPGPPKGLPLLERAFPRTSNPAPRGPNREKSPGIGPGGPPVSTSPARAANPAPSNEPRSPRRLGPPASSAREGLTNNSPEVPDPSRGASGKPRPTAIAPPLIPVTWNLIEAIPDESAVPEVGATSKTGPRRAGDRAARTADPAVTRAQLEEDISGGPPTADAGELPPPVEAPATGGPALESPVIDDAPVVPNLSPSSSPETPPTVEPLPGPEGAPAPPVRPTPLPEEEKKPEPEASPIQAYTQRITRILPRDGGPGFSIHPLPIVDGVQTLVVKGGVNIVTNAPAPTGTIDISADSAIIWRSVGQNKEVRGPNGEYIEPAGQPLEVYLEGNVIVRQDTRQFAGTSDQKTFRAKQAYYDLRSGRFVGLDAEIDMFAPGLIAPTRMFAPRIDQFRPLVPGPDGKLRYGFEQIQADHTVMTGSRFPTPGYRFTSRSIDVTKVVSTKTNPSSGRTAGNPKDPKTPQELTWRIEARRNFFFLGPVPVFYYPRFVGNADDLEPPLRSVIFRNNNYLGNQVLSDFNGFRLLSIRQPVWIDNWNVDLDYLSMRTKDFPALGSEIAWFGKDFLRDLTDPYHRRKDPVASSSSPDGYFGYFDIWGLHDSGVDDLGSGPAIITNTRASELRFGKSGIQRGPNSVPHVPPLGVPAFVNPRFRVNLRHMQSLLGEDADQDEDFRIQVEAAYVSDRYFLEEYYKRLNETGLDQETLAYLIRQKHNWAWSIWTEANLQNFYTDTQWLPRVDYYRLGDAVFNKWFTYDQHSGLDYANTHTAAEVNNPYIFAFMPYDPISNTSRTFQSGRFYTNHELDLPLNFANILRVVPYVQGQAVGWTNQINGQAIGRVWGAAGARLDFMVWKKYPNVESELFNVHGLNNKISFQADYRDAYSNVKLQQLGVQDDLDDNTDESTRRYFALTNYTGGVLPPQYDPRHLILRRVLSPITGPTDIQASIETLQLNIHQRLQTKRGPEGRRRVIDYMTLDATTTYFPYASRDNFNKPFGQNMYNWQWFVGDRTSVISYGWFEFFDITGKPIFPTNTGRHNNPFGLNVVTSGVSISRPPRGNVYIGYTVLDTGPINTSALTTTLSYWLSPKWYGSYSNMYDFGNGILLSSYFAVTRVGSDYLTSIGLSVDPQRNSYMFAVQIAPRLSPNIRLGSGVGTTQFDSRLAPTQ